MRWALFILITTAEVSRADGFVRLRNDTGGCLFWGRSDLHYQVAAAGAGGRAFTAQEQAAFARAFEQWRQTTVTCSDFTLALDAGQRDSRAVNEGGPNTIVMRGRSCDALLAHPDPCEADPKKAFGVCGTKYDCWYEPEDALSHLTLAFTTTSYVPKTGRITEADISFMGALRRDGSSNQFTTSDVDVVNDLQSILTHELGHALGFAHTSTPGLMFESLPNGSIAMRTVDEGTRAGFCDVYGTGASVACTTEQALSLPPPRIIANTSCSTSPEGGAVWVLVVGFMRRRRRQAPNFVR